MPGIARAQAWATREESRAVRAAEIADRHEHLAEQASPTLQALHLNMADIHRGMERRHRAAARMHTDYTDRLTARAAMPTLMAAVATAIGAQHVGLTVLGTDRTEALTMASDSVATEAQDAEFTLGEGPAHDVTSGGAPVVADESMLPARWPHFAPQVARLGVRSVIAAPLTTTNGCFGALTVFDPGAQDRPVAMLRAVADALVNTTLLVEETDAIAVPLLAGVDSRAVVHQAAGMVAVQLGCTATDALAALRARAFAEDRPITALATEVVRRKLRLA